MKKYLQLLLISTSVLVAAGTSDTCDDGWTSWIARSGAQQVAKSLTEQMIVCSQTNYGQALKRILEEQYVFDEGYPLHGEIEQFREALRNIINKRIEDYGPLSSRYAEDIAATLLIIKYKTGNHLPSFIFER